MQTSLLLEMAADTFPDRIAVGPLDRPMSTPQLYEMTGRARVWLESQPGDKLVFCGLNGWAFPALLFASARAGRPIVPLNYRLPDADLQKLLARTAPAVAVIDDDMLERFPETDGITIVPRSRFEAVCEASDAPPPDTPDAESDIALLLFTSGTTGEPKTAVLRHHHLTSYVISTVEFMGAEETEAALISVPPYHIAGVSAVLTGIYGGRRLVYMPVFTPEAWVDTAEREGVTQAMVVPTMLDRILDVLERTGKTLPALRSLSYGGGRMPLPVIERAMRALPHVDFVNAYGLTETSSTIAVLGPEDHRKAVSSDDPAARRRLGSVGRPLPTVELEIQDTEGRTLPAGEVGEVCVRGDQVAGEYLNGAGLPEDGWFRTKDAGWLDEEGYLFIDGRLDDVIVRGGENISPGEIEDILREHAEIADVAVLGLPDRQWGEKVGAVIVVRDSHHTPDVGELANWVKARLRSTKTPEFWEFRDELPYNETGKLLRRVLKMELSD